MKLKASQRAPVRIRRVRSFGNTTPILLGSVGADGNFKFLSPAWAKALGYAGEELRDLALHELVPLTPPDALAIVRQLLDTARPGPMEFRLRCKDGTQKHFLWHRRFDPEMKRMFIAGEEVSEQGFAAHSD